MAKETYNGEISMKTDWGNADGMGTPLNGQQVQEFIKREFGLRFGYLNMRFNESESMYYIECFENEADYKEYETLDDKTTDYAKTLLLQSVLIPISTVEGDSFTASLRTSLKVDANIVVSGNDLIVPLNYRSIKISQNGNENAYYNGTLNVFVSTDGETWNLAGTLPNKLIPQAIDDTDTMQDGLNIGQFLVQGRQQVRLNATYEVTTEDGSKKIVTSGNVLVGASVTKTNLGLKLITEYHIPMSPTDSNTNVQNFNVTYQVNGAAQKTLFVKVDNGSEVKYDYDPTVNGSNQTIEISGNQYLTHGVHKVEAWLECSDGLGGKITSEKLVNRFMMVADKSNTTPYLLLQNVDGWIDNFVQTEICEYAVYSPIKDTPIDVTFLLTNYGNTLEYFRLEASVMPQTANKLLTTVEIEAENDAQQQDTYQTYFRVNRKDGDAWVDFMQTSTGETNYVVYVDNTNAMTPVTGATFLLNPKVRNNNEANPLQILNAKNNNAVVPSEWTNADLINGMWTTDEAGNKVLRIMAGTKLEIKKDVWAQFRENPASSLTFEIDCKISNVTNTTDPIIQMFSGTASSFRGLKMNALEGWLRNGTEQNADDTLFAWDEDVRTHFSFNLHHQVQPNKGDVKFPQGDADKANGTIALARVMVNGDIVRELKYDTSKTDEWTTSNTGSIIIGNEGADIDIYSIRIYEKKQIEAKDILMRNFLATLPKAEDKVALKAKNNIMDGDRIGLENAKNAKLNCMVWHGALPYFYDQDDRNGWMEIWRYDENGNYLPDLSGTICKATKLLAGKGQGSTAKTYYDWNLQDDSSKVKYNFAEQRGTILVALKDIHESIVVGAPYEGTIDEDKDKGGQYSGLVVDVYGGNLGKNFPLENKAKAYPYVNGSVMFPDGWVDGNGKYRGMGYMVAYGTALAQKRVIKINYASSMQSHLIGACKTYDLLHRKVVGDTPLQERVPTAVSAKHTEPFMFFNEDGNGTFFNGMGTYGAGKADKVAWAFVKKEMPMYALIEGSDNNLPMTGFRVPFDKNTAEYDCNGEGWLYNGIQSFDFDLGCTEHFSDATQQGEGWKFVNTDANDGEVPSKAIRDKWADIHNFIYLHSTNLRFFDGTFDQFKNSDAAKDTNYKYWCTQGSDAFILKRYDFIGEQWVEAGLLAASGTYYNRITIKNLPFTGYYEWEKEGSGDYSRLNDILIEGVVSSMKKNLKYFINEKSLQFNYCYVLGFLAGTDNSDKNTYYKIMPYGIQMESDSSFSSFFRSFFSKDFDFSSVHQLYFDGDDMDSILRTNNNAHLTKPYYLDRMHPYADEKPDVPLYEGLQNQLFNFVEKAYEGTHELSSVMNQIMIAATELITEDDTKNGLVGGKSLWGFLNKYFFNVQRYFPQIAYIEQARIRYEFPELLGFISSGGGARSIRPITQSLGSQLQAEFQYMKQRVIYMTSYAGFGAWSGATQSIGLEDANDTFNFMPDFMPDGKTLSTYTFTIQTHQYLYPSSFNGQTHTLTHQRVKPNTPFTFTIAKDMGKSDTGIGIHGVHYLSDLGELSDKSISERLVIRGKRLKAFSSNIQKGIMRASSVTIEGAYNIKNFAIALNILEIANLSKLIRLSRFQSDGVENVEMPKTNNLTYIYANLYSHLRLEDVPNLASLNLYSSVHVISVYAGRNVGTNVKVFSLQPLAEGLWTYQKTSTNPKLQSLHVENVNWTDFDVEALSWLADRPTCELKGTISIKEDHPQGLPRVTWDLKNKFNAKFGNVDNLNSSSSKGLKMIYQEKPFNADGATVKGNFYVEAGDTFRFEVRPSSMYENTQRLIGYDIRNASGVEMNYNTGVLTVRELSETKQTATVRAHVFYANDGVGNEAIVTKTIEIWNRPAQVGDLVYADGTFSSKESYDGEKTVIGRCFYVAPKKNGQVNAKLNDPNDKWLRMMVAADDVYVNNANSHQWGVYPLNIDEAHQDTNSLFYLDDNDVMQNLSIDGVSIADIQTITNITSGGLTKQNENGEWVGTSYIDDASYRDLTDEGYENDGFRMYDQNTAVGDGFGADTTGRVLDDALAKLAGSGYAKGDIVNSSYAKTLKVIYHRNGIISHVQESGEGINGLYPPLDFPTASGSKTELQHLGDLITAVREWAKSTGQGAPGETVNFNKWSQLLYPAASACYAYEPTNLMDGEVLNPKFKAHNWALPTDGILARLFWYTYDGKGYDTAATPKEGGVLDTVTNPNGKVVFKKITTSHLWSVTEYNSTYSWYVSFGNGRTYGTYKYLNTVGRAVSAF